MSLAVDLAYPFFGGSSIGLPPGFSHEPVLGVFPVKIGRHGYEIDGKSGEHRHVSIPMLRQQADQSSSPAEASLNPDDLWRRAQDSWHRGAGQECRDRPDSDPDRFRSSKGVDIWTRYRMSLLPGTLLKRTTSTQVAVAGTRLYSINGTTLEYTSDVTAASPTWTTVTGGSPASFVSLASDGTTLLITDGADVWATNTTVSTKSVFNTLNCTIIDRVKGRWMAANGPSIYNIIDGTVPSALFTHANSSFSWVGFAEGESAIYAAGYSGDKSLIYRITIKDDATALDAPVVAGSLPDGEVVRSIGGYLGFIVVGTDLGWRFCISNAQGDLTIGALVRTPFPVRCFEGQDRFVWYGYTKYDNTSSGLGRLDVTQINDPLVPAWASDLMASVQSDVTSVATFQSRRVFCAGGLYVEDPATIVSAGTLDTGFVGFGLPDTKIGLFFDVRTDPLNGSYTAAISADTAPFVPIGVQAEVLSRGAQFPMGQLQGDRFEARLTLNRSVVSPQNGPVVIRWTMKSAPAVELREYVYAPLLLHDVVTVRGQDYPVNVAEEVEFIKGLRTSQMLTVYQEGTEIAYAGQVTDYEWRPWGLSPKGTHFQGTMLVKFRRVL